MSARQILIDEADLLHVLADALAETMASAVIIHGERSSTVPHPTIG